MKKALAWLLILLCLMACCSGSNTSSTAGSLVKKTNIEWHHTENCRGHSDTIEKITFELDGHEMWLLILSQREGNTILHSPDCPKCNPEKIESPVIEEKSDYWGW